MSARDDIANVLAGLLTTNGLPQGGFYASRARERFLGYADALLASPAHAELIRAAKEAAWNEGFKQGGPMHDVDYDNPGSHRTNPYDVARLEDIAWTVDLCRDRLDEFTLDELSSTLDDHPIPPEGFCYVSKRAEAAEAAIQRVRDAVAEIDAVNDLDLIGTYPGDLRDEITQQIDEALEGDRRE